MMLRIVNKILEAFVTIRLKKLLKKRAICQDVSRNFHEDFLSISNATWEFICKFDKVLVSKHE